MVQNQGPKPLIGIAAEGLRYQYRSLEKPHTEKEGSPKLCDCMLKLESRKSGHRCLFTGSNLFRERKQGTFHTWASSYNIVCFLSWPKQLCVVYEKLLSNTRMTEVGIFAFSSGFLLHLKPVLPASSEKDLAKGKSQIGMTNLNY